MNEKEILERISGYGLMETLIDTLQVVVVGGVAKSTIYKAFQKGGTTPRHKIIIETAEQILAQHECQVAEAVMAL